MLPIIQLVQFRRAGGRNLWHLPAVTSKGCGCPHGRSPLLWGSGSEGSRCVGNRMRLQLAVPRMSRAIWASGNLAVLYLLAKKFPLWPGLTQMTICFFGALPGSCFWTWQVKWRCLSSRGGSAARPASRRAQARGSPTALTSRAANSPATMKRKRLTRILTTW